jgi:DNA-binding NarL/FixJ family response regulator
MLKISLSSVPNLEVVEAVGNGNAAIESAKRLDPDVILMDIELGSDPNGINAGRAIKSDRPETGIVILSSHRERQYLNLIAVEESSGWSYLLKQSVSDAGSLARAIEGAASGLVVMDPAVVNSMKPRKGSITAGLTPRQQEVLTMMAQGYNNAAIAEKLVLGTKSVENYINAIYQELNLSHNGPLHPRVQAVLSYIRDAA